MTHGVIYKITCNPTRLSYIGKTIQKLQVRLAEHKGKYSYCRLLSDAIKEYRWDNFYVEILWEGPSEILGEMERKFIEEHGTLSPNGYNLREGGGRSEKVSEESRNLMIKKQREIITRKGELLGSIVENKSKIDGSITSWTLKGSRNGKTLKIANSKNKEELIQMQKDFTKDPDGYNIPERTHNLNENKGIWFRKDRQKWVSTLSGKNLGSYPTEEEAVIVRDQYKKYPDNFVLPKNKDRNDVGVTFNKSSNKWEAKFCENKKNIFLGRYDSKQEAIDARKSFIESPDTFIRPNQRKKIKI